MVELTEELQNKLAHESVLASPELVAKVSKDKEVFSKWQKKLQEERNTYGSFLDKFPNNPFIREEDVEQGNLNEMEEARPFPNAWA